MAAGDALSLSVVEAYYYDPSSGQLVEALPENRIVASDFVDKWNGWRGEIAGTYGWELLISPPNDSNDPRAAQGYTKAMFRTPEDQALLYSESPSGATPVDTGAHQAGRAVDLDLDAMQALYPDFDYSVLASIASKYGIYNRLVNSDEPEPWHFDDNPAQLFGSSQAAI